MASERARPRAPPFIDPPRYARHRPEATLLYQLVERYYPELAAAREAVGRPFPKYVQEEFAAYLKCGRLEHGFLRVRCEDCHAEKLVAFSCKRRGFCPSCGARRMTDGAALLADEVLPAKPIRQWVLSLPFALRFLLAPLLLAQQRGRSKVLSAAALGLKEIDRVGDPATEIIMRYGATVAAAKAGSSPEFLVQRREPGAAKDPMHHAIFRVSDIAATVAAAKAAGATMEGEVVTVPIGGAPIKIAMLVDPDGNALELMELPKGLDHLPH